MSIDEAYVDFTGLGCPRAMAAQVRTEFATLTGGLTVSAGIGNSMLMAKIATSRAKPNGIFTIPPTFPGGGEGGGEGGEGGGEGGARAFLHDLPLSELPGVGYHTRRRLAERGMETCADATRRSKQALQVSSLSLSPSLFPPLSPSPLPLPTWLRII